MCSLRIFQSQTRNIQHVIKFSYMILYKNFKIYIKWDEWNPTKVVRARSTLKQMVACFFRKTGHVATVPLMHRQTINSEWYTTICLLEVFGKIRETNRWRRIILHHDNASSHTSAQTRDFLRTENIELMGHPAYSPNLATNDFFLFPHIKNKLRGQRYSTPEEVYWSSWRIFWKIMK